MEVELAVATTTHEAAPLSEQESEHESAETLVDSELNQQQSDRIEAEPSSRTTGMAIRWDYLGFFTVMHLLALLVFVPWFFSWAGVVVFVAGVILFGQLGIPIAYHRLLTHRSFKTPKWFEHTLVTLAMCSGQETPARWVAWHRMHHAFSDQRDDPHSPRLGFLWAHFRWTLHERRTASETFTMYKKYARDILADRYYLWIEKFPFAAGAFFIVHAVLYGVIATVVCLLVFGNSAEAYRMSASLFIWGVAARTVWVWHITWSVNSLGHLFGYRNYETKDGSRNNWLVTLLTSGEGWHNNHHADPASASMQHRWWEIDFNYYLIQLFGLVGLADQIIRPRIHRQDESVGSDNEQ